ncbi:MAG: alpha-L-fucosidase [Chitinophagaceae bacterium]
MLRIACSILVMMIISSPCFSQFQPNWQSIDNRTTPQWFRDAKFGIFIHWGVYSVPGWSSKGQYAEWYQQGLQGNDTARKRFHKTKFGERTYYDLANDFKAELFNPDEWARLFERSGAKYIVLTSKHHDGYALWPSKEADKTWGFTWNAAGIGPKRDLLGDLFKAVRKTSVHTGMYYSLYEWFNPLWKSDRDRFVKEHTWPQMKDLVNTYQPDVFWTDGDWDASAETWKSQEFLAWLFNESAVKDRVVVNDRWGSGMRFAHGGIYTPEYQPDLDFEDHYWEESRGMGYSYGYNREEDAWDYNSTQSLVLQLVDKVSRGGNFLLDIGPDEHGKIPPIMQERLLEIGEWLQINGEAIYGTSRWKETSQWSEGRRDYKDRSGDMLLKITIDPDPGFAVKELFYTYNATADNLYAIFPKYPTDRKLVLKNFSFSSGTNVHFLTTKEALTWKQEGNDVVLELPAYDPNKFKAPYAFAVRISSYGKFAKKPVISTTYAKGSLAPIISISPVEGTIVRYTTDGSEPGEAAMVYTKPFTINTTGIVKAKAFLTDALPGGTAEQAVIKYQWMNAAKVKAPQPGISYKYYEPDGKIDMNVFHSVKTVKTGIADIISVNEKHRPDKFAFLFEGYVKIDKDGAYTFFISSDDGSKLFLDDTEIIDNDGDHGSVEKSGKAFLKKGYHKIKVMYFDSGGGNDLKVSMQAEGGKKAEVGAFLLFH